MNHKWITRVVGICLMIMVAVVFCSGCESVKQAYPGPALPRDRVAVVKDYFSVSQGFYIDAIECDGEKINEKNQGGITLLPGKHTITYNAIGIVGVQGFQEIARGSTEVSVEAGGIYLATGHMTTRAQVDVKTERITPGYLSVNIEPTNTK